MQTTTINKMPSCIEIENFVIGELIQYNKKYFSVSKLLKPNMFYDTTNSKVYEYIQLNDGKVSDMMLFDYFQKNNLANNRIVEYVESFVHDGYTKDITYFAAVIVDYYCRRESIMLSVKFNSLSQHMSSDIYETIDKIKDSLDNIKNAVPKAEISSIKQGVEAFEKEYDRIEKEGKDAKIKVPYGFESLNNFTNGGENIGDFTIIAGERSQGKTSFVLSNIYHAATANKDYKAAIISLEMTNAQMTNRFIAYETYINTKKLNSYDLEKEDWETYESTIGNLINKQIFFVNCNSDYSTVKELTYELINKHKVNMIFIDYINKIQTKKNFNNNTEKYAQICAEMFDIGKQNDTNIWMGMQLNKSEVKCPNIDRLREGAQAADVADNVLFIFRPEAYGQNERFTDDYELGQSQFSPENAAQIIRAKGRNYGTTSSIISFTKDLTLFSENASIDGIDTIEPIERKPDF